ncbi:MAG: 23S rRNA (guanosine(2251)-2'-O)-methyltransferase RlmB [Cyanobacteriota bacterium]|nr:23S rRNA (guanosine(2251)-2'-O)-methyltransferase RlmB [Cyanobacteriota bacterium]
MSPRFERRPEKRTGSGPRADSRVGRFQPRREGSGGRPERPGRRPEGRGEYRSEGRGEGRSEFRSDVRSDFRRDSRPGRPEARSEGRLEGRGEFRREFRSEGRPEGRREGGWQGNREARPGGERRFGERRPGSGAERSFSRRPGGPRPGGDRPGAGRKPFGSRPLRERSFDRSSFDRSGDRPSRGPVVIDAPAAPPAGESERFGIEPSPDLVWGRHAALAALESGRPIHRIWCTPEMRFSPKFLQLLREAKSSGVLVEEVTWARLGQISGGAVHQGIVLQTAAAETLDLPSLIEGCRSLGEPPVLMAVDGLTDPHNLGAIVRSAEALGAHGLVLPQRRNAGLTGTVAKVAAGALENLPVARVVNLNRSLEALKDEGYRVIGLAGEGSVTLEEADLDGPLVVVTGSEGEGLSMLTRRTCDQLVRIPLRGATPSLNASVATALLLYEIARRGWMKGISGSQPAPRISRPAIPNAAPIAAVESAGEPAASVEPQQLESAVDLPALAAESALAAEPAPELAPEPGLASEVAVDPASPAVELGLDPATASSFNGDIQL